MGQAGQEGQEEGTGGGRRRGRGREERRRRGGGKGRDSFIHLSLQNTGRFLLLTMNFAPAKKQYALVLDGECYCELLTLFHSAKLLHTDLKGNNWYRYWKFAC